jgi:hypothetical protein
MILADDLSEPARAQAIGQGTRRALFQTSGFEQIAHAPFERN